MNDITINGAVLLAAIGSLCSVIVYLYRRGEARSDKEMERLVNGYEERLSELKALAFRSTDVSEKAIEVVKRGSGIG